MEGETIHETCVQLFEIKNILRELVEEIKSIHHNMPSSCTEEEYNRY